MEIITNLQKINIQKSVVCVGNFDGLHRGHREIIDKTVNYSNQQDAKSIVFSFWPHPRLVLNPSSHLEYLYSYQEKIEIFESTGIDALILYPFNREFAAMSSDSFIKNILIDKLKMIFFVIGYDHQFGKDREGNYQQLLKRSKELNFGIERISEQSFGGENISSTKIRQFLKNGMVDKANKFMAHPFFVMGKVEHGKRLGNKIGFPTANINYPKQKIVPKNGVYLVKIELKNKCFTGIANLGYKPTVTNKRCLGLEVHIFDFNQDIYGENIKVSLLQFLRQEEKFDSIEGLKRQIKTDVAQAKLLEAK